MLPDNIVSAKALLIPTQEGHGSQLEDMDLEEYEFDIVWNKEKEVWVTTLINGDYLLNVKAKGFKEINQRIFISSENTEFEFEMISEEISIPRVTVVAIDIEN